MPPDVLERVAASGIREPQVVFAPSDTGGTLCVNLHFAPILAQLGLHTASAFLDLPGEVVSGHPDRHVMRVQLPGLPQAFYLKRQHIVGWREKLRNRLAGFGWVSRCEREAEVLQQLEDAKLPAPRWAAFGTHGHRAFLLVEEVPGSIELRRLLNDNALSRVERASLAANIGKAAAAVHAAGFTTPDLTAKHVLVNPRTLAVTFLDWQSATRLAHLSDASRADSLGALHASLAVELATPRERLLALRAYSFAALPTDAVVHAAVRHANRRSVRDQLPPPSEATQRLVWLAGEAVCAVPEIAAVWPRPAIVSPFYGRPAGASRIAFVGREAVLVRGASFAPLGRFRARLRATPWRSPGVTIGRVLFHLERYGVPAPRLFAFGQRITNAIRAEWFALYETPSGVPLREWGRTASAGERRAIRDSLMQCVRKLHDAGCVLLDPNAAFTVRGDVAMVADPRAVKIVRRVSDSAHRRDERAVFRLLDGE